MPLAQVPTQIVTDPKNYLHLVYGEPGSGKTSWCSQIDGHYFINTEAGLSGVSVYGDPVFDWVSFCTKMVELRDARAAGFEGLRRIETIIIDSYDALWSMCGEYIMNTEKFIIKGHAQQFRRVSDVEYGKAYARVNEEVMGAITKLRLWGYGVVLIAHQKERVVKWRGQELNGIGLALSQSAEDAVVKACDAIGYMMIDETVDRNEQGAVTSVVNGRFMYWQPTFLRLAKHRLENFPERLENPINKGFALYEKTFHEYAQRKVDSLGTSS